MAQKTELEELDLAVKPDHKAGAAVHLQTLLKASVSACLASM